MSCFDRAGCVQGAELGIEFLASSDEGRGKSCRLSRSDTGPVRLGLGFGRCQSGMRRCDRPSRTIS